MSLTPYAKYTRQMTSRMRARMHSQNYNTTVQKAVEARPLDSSIVAEEQLSRLAALRSEHMSSLDASLRLRALNIIQTLPLKALKDDAHMAYTLSALRTCAYFNATSSMTVFNLLNHITRNSFALDACNMYQVCTALAEMQHSQTAEVLELLRPRLLEVADDLTEVEARTVLTSYADHGLVTPELSEKLTQIMIGALREMPLRNLMNYVACVSRVGTRKIAREFIEAATPRLCEVLREATEQHHFYKVTYLQAPTNASCTSSGTPGAAAESGETPTERVQARLRAEEVRQQLVSELYFTLSLQRELHKRLAWLCWAPRRLLNEVVRCALIWSEPVRLEGGGGGDAVDSDPSSSAQQARAEQDQLLGDLSQMRRRSLCHCLKMMHYTSYRNLPALRLLTARVAVLKDVMGTTSKTRLAAELAEAVEAVAYFRAMDCAPAVVSIIDDIWQHISTTSAIAARSYVKVEDMRLVEQVMLRVLLSSTRLLVTDMRESSPDKPKDAAQGAAMRALLVHTVTIMTCPLLQSYMHMAVRKSTGNRTRQLPKAVCMVNIAAAAHFFYIAAVADEAVRRQEVALPTETTTAMSELRRQLKVFPKWSAGVLETKPDSLVEETAVEIAETVAMLKKRPAVWTDAEASTLEQSVEF